MVAAGVAQDYLRGLRFLRQAIPDGCDSLSAVAGTAYPLLSVYRLLFASFGWRIAAGYAAVCCASIAVLSATYVASVLGLHHYVAQQLARLPWDLTVAQQSAVGNFEPVRERLRSALEAGRVEAVGLLRVPVQESGLRLTLGGVRPAVRWLVVISASQPTLLPPELRTDPGPSLGGAALAFVSSSPAASGQGQWPSDSRILLAREVPTQARETSLLDERASAAPVNVRRVDFNRWMLGVLGTLVYLPDEALVVQVGWEEFRELAQRYERVFLGAESEEGGVAPTLYMPEVIHLLQWRRSTDGTPWDLGAAASRAEALSGQAEAGARQVGARVYVENPLFRLLARMRAVGRLLGLASFLVAAPLLVLSWTLGRVAGAHILMNVRRRIALALLRGVSQRAIRSTIQLACLLGVTLGSIVGVAVGVTLPLFEQRLAAHSDLPPVSLWCDIYFPAVLLAGLALGWRSERRLARQLRNLTAREAIQRHAPAASGERHPSRLQRVATFLALLLGSGKIASWLLGAASLVEWLPASASENLAGVVGALDAMLGLVAIPLALAGLAGLLQWRRGWARRLVTHMGLPAAGPLRGFLAQGLYDWDRGVTVAFLSALCVATAMAPIIAAASFTDRASRTARAGVGADVQFEYSAAALGAGCDRQPIDQCIERVLPPVQRLEAALRRLPAVSSVATVYEFIAPGVYVRSQAGVLIDLIEDPRAYRDTVYFEEAFGISRPFTAALAGMAAGGVDASAGLLRARHLSVGQSMDLSGTQAAAPRLILADAVGLLPGQPARLANYREGYATAELDYLNYVDGTDARLYAARVSAAARLRGLPVIASRVTVLARAAASVPGAAGIISGAAVPFAPDAVRTAGVERARWSSDMFISLVLHNMSILVAAGLALATAAMLILGHLSLQADGSWLALLRMRGVARAMLLRLVLATALAPVLCGVILGTGLGTVFGGGLSRAVWDLSYRHGYGAFTENRIVIDSSAALVALVSTVTLGMVAGLSASWPLWRHGFLRASGR